MSTLDKLCSNSVLSAEARRDYDEDGFIVLRGVFKAEETARLAFEADRLLDRTDLIDKQNLRCRFQGNCTGGDCVFETFDPVIDLSAANIDVARPLAPARRAPLPSLCVRRLRDAASEPDRRPGGPLRGDGRASLGGGLWSGGRRPAAGRFARPCTIPDQGACDLTGWFGPPCP